jgi:hypothetical protein
MNSSILPSIWRFLGLAFVQTILLNQVTLSVHEPYFNILLYPLFILLLPLELAAPYIVLLGFLMGLTVDFYYASFGIHASAGAFSGFIRPVVLAAFAPKGGFSGKEPIYAPAYFGWSLFLQTAAVFLLLHLFWYFSVDAFTFVYFGSIALKTLVGWLLSMVFVILYVILFNPKS